MPNLKLEQPGEIRLMINDDPGRMLVFNPEDVSFANRFYEAYEYLAERQTHYAALDAELEALPEGAKDGHGFDLKAIGRLRGQMDMCGDMRKAIDKLFGEGTCQMAFGDANVPSQFMQLLSGVMPYLTAAREKKSAKYRKNGAGAREGAAGTSEK